MNDANLLVVAMAEQCKAIIQKTTLADVDLPEPLHPHHLIWMCERIENQVEDWPATKLHRWIGFVQSGMMANGMLNFQQTKAMFDEAKNAYGGGSDDDDLIDHLNSDCSFKLDIGGEG